MPSQIGRCKPRDELVEEHATVVVELRKRSSDSQNAKALAEKKAFQKAKAIRENAGAAALQRTVEAGGGAVHQYGKKSLAEVNEQIMRYIVRSGSPLSTVDCIEFREMARCIALAGSSYLSSFNDQGVLMPKRKHFTEHELPALDKKLDEQVRTKLLPIMKITGATYMGDGFDNAAKTPVMNAILGTVSGNMLIEAKDTTDIIKSMQWIGQTAVAHIRSTGTQLVVGATFDGACSGAFTEITKYPDTKHILCFVDLAHTWDGYLRAMFSLNVMIKMKSCPHKDLGEQVVSPSESASLLVVIIFQVSQPVVNIVVIIFQVSRLNLNHIGVRMGGASFH